MSSHNDAIVCCMHMYLRALMLAGLGTCGSVYCAQIGLPVPPCQNHIPDNHPHDQLCHQHVHPNGCLLSQSQEECVPCSLLHLLPVVQSLPDDVDCCWYPLQGHQSSLGRPSQTPCSDCLFTACLRLHVLDDTLLEGLGTCISLRSALLLSYLKASLYSSWTGIVS